METVRDFITVGDTDRNAEHGTGPGATRAGRPGMDGVGEALALLKEVSLTAAGDAARLGFRGASDFAGTVEEVARIVEYLQLVEYLRIAEYLRIVEYLRCRNRVWACCRQSPPPQMRGRGDAGEANLVRPSPVLQGLPVPLG